jgi:hypothetical protein
MSVQLYWKRVIFSNETQVVVGHDRKMYPPFGNILAITGHTLSPRVSKYFVVFIFPSISVNVPTPSKVMHPQNITATRRTIKIKLQNSKCDILNKNILVREVKKIWVGLTPVYIQRLYSSISRRI